MKFSLKTRKINSVLKSVLVIAMAVIFALNPLSVVTANAGSESEGMEWTLVTDMSVFHNETNNHTLNDNYGWTPILICWQSGGQSYFLQANNRSGDEYAGTQATVMNGVKVGEASFTTRSNLNSLLCKHEADRGSNQGAYLLGYRASDGSIGSHVLALNLKWYGAAWAAAAKGMFRDAPRDNPDSAEDESGPASNASIRCPWDFKYAGNNQYEIFWESHASNVYNRHWHICGNEVEINAHSKSTSFYVYIGKVVPAAVRTTSSTLQPYTYTKLTTQTIKSNVELVVSEGACLVLDGTIFNCGHILVDGGTLVIRGLLESETGSSGSSSNGSFAPGDITVKNGGKLIIERSGVLVHRNNSSGVYIKDDSSVYIEGTLVVAKTLSIGDNCSLRAMPGSFIGIGIQPNSTTGADTYTPDNIAANCNVYLDSLANCSPEAHLYLGKNSSFISNGAVFKVEHAADSYGNNSYIDALFSGSIYASLSTMMRQW